jgi:hypothetical protein
MTKGPDLLVAAFENEGVAQGDVLVVLVLGLDGRWSTFTGAGATVWSQQ